MTSEIRANVVRDLATVHTETPDLTATLKDVYIKYSGEITNSQDQNSGSERAGSSHAGSPLLPIDWETGYSYEEPKTLGYGVAFYRDTTVIEYEMQKLFGFCRASNEELCSDCAVKLRVAGRIRFFLIGMYNRFNGFGALERHTGNTKATWRRWMLSYEIEFERTRQALSGSSLLDYVDMNM
jgi:hypothetical protein